VSSSADKTVRVWSISAGECLQTLGYNSAFCHALVRLSESKFVVGYDKTIRVGDERGDWKQHIDAHTETNLIEGITAMVRIGDVIVTSSEQKLEMRQLR